MGVVARAAPAADRRLPRGNKRRVPMSIAYVALGANLPTSSGDARSTLTQAFEALAHLPTTAVTAHSSFYQTAPVDADGPDFINAAATLDTALDAPSLLAALLAIEHLHGRTRPATPAGQHAARTLDLDLLMHGDAVIDTPFLTLPHPRMHQRAFVLAPLAEIAPQLVIPGHGRVSDCLNSLGGQRVSRITD